MTQQYFSIDDFQSFYGNLDNANFDNIKLVTTDTYNEQEVAKNIEIVGKDICAMIAIQLAIIGSGNNNYGSIYYQDKLIELSQFFHDNKIIYRANLGDQLEPGTLTPRRLVRFFRFLIRDFIVKTGRSSYLFRKYCPIQDPKLSSIIFPGFEHLATPDNDSDNVIIYLQTYMILDSRQNPPSQITERIKRVLLARGFSLNFLNSIIVNV